MTKPDAARAGETGGQVPRAEDERNESDTSGADAQAPTDVWGTGEATLRQLVALRSTVAVDEQLGQLMRLVDSATWSVPIPITLILAGVIVRGMLVPSEVSAAFLDDTLGRAAQSAADVLAKQDEAEVGAVRVEQARGFLQRMKRRPFSVAQARLRRRNADALMELGRWHAESFESGQVNVLDFPGSYANPASGARRVVPYASGQPALTLADAKILAGGEWLSLGAPIRIALGHIGAWAVDETA